MFLKLYFIAYLFFFSLTIIFVFSCSKSPTESKENHPQIEVTEDITEDTIWESGNDYIVKGEIVVEENALLTIKKDVNVILTSNSTGKPCVSQPAFRST